MANTKGQKFTEAVTNFYHDLDAGVPYLRFHIQLLRLDSIPKVNFYIKRGNSFSTFCSKEKPFSPMEIRKLLDEEIHTLYLEKQDAQVICSYLDSFLPTQSKIIATDQKSVEKIFTDAIDTTKEIFQVPSKENIKKGLKIVSNYVNLLIRDMSVFYYLAKISTHDHYTFQHSVGTSIHAVALAIKLGLDQSIVTDVGIAGLLHDLGKIKVRPELINKTTDLSQEEWKEMNEHVYAGYQLIKEHPDISEAAKWAVLHHHENMIGTGYPDKLKKSQISIQTKIVTIADIFNALVTDRPYSKARSPFEALTYMKDKVSEKFDSDLFEELVMIYGGKLAQPAAKTA